MARFFIAGTNFPNGRAIIRGRDADHIRVLRLRAGDDIVICDGAGRDYKCRLVQTLEHTPCLMHGGPFAEEAAKQSGRGIIPQVRYEADFVAVLNGALHTDLPLFMYETGERETIRDAIEHTAQPIASAAIITGPEGGFAEFEADMARKLGMHICSMGERILRCETAPVVALTALMYGTGNL